MGSGDSDEVGVVPWGTVGEFGGSNHLVSLTNFLFVDGHFKSRPQ